MRRAVESAGGQLKIVAPKVSSDSKAIKADFELAGGPSALFDTIALVMTEKGAEALMQEAAAKTFVSDALAHLKAIGHTTAASSLLRPAGVQEGEAGIVPLGHGAPGALTAAVIEAGRQRFSYGSLASGQRCTDR